MASCPSCGTQLDGSTVCSHCEAPDAEPSAQPDAAAEQPENAPPAPAAEPHTADVSDGPTEGAVDEPEESATEVISALPDDPSDPATIQLRQVEPAPEAPVTEVIAATPDAPTEVVAERAARREALAVQLAPGIPDARATAAPEESNYQEPEAEELQRRPLRGSFIAAAAVLALGAASAIALSSGSTTSVPPTLAPTASDSPSAADQPSDSPSAKAGLHGAPTHSVAGVVHTSASPSHHATAGPDAPQSTASTVHVPSRSSATPGEPISRPTSSSPSEPTPKHSCSAILPTLCPTE